MDETCEETGGARIKGFVQSFNRDRGYGFLVPYGAPDAVYVERADIECGARTLSEEQQVSFTVEFAAGRFVAKHVRP
ncbi:cold-shock protein [Streptomyces sp. NPDC059917]|uniref:cold-shock protein n=1 Tax=Streptomyces sp. NPDC059917 TaxID=3347002 RepID=UPI003653AA07